MPVFPALESALNFMRLKLSHTRLPLLFIFEVLLSLVLIYSAVQFVVSSWHWPFVGDAPLMHYVVFLMHHGFTPYRTIIDLNFPGTIATEASVMWLFGKGALAWRIFDLLLLGAIGASMGVICRSYGKFPALFAGVTFALIHGRDGLIELGQRDLLIAAFLAAAYAALFEATRSRRGEHFGATLFAGVCLGAACTVKPDAIVLPPLLLALVANNLRLQGRRWVAHIWVACIGVALPLLAMLGFLLREHALPAFIDLMSHLAQYHASTWRLSSRELLLGSVSSVLLPLFCLWAIVFVAEKRWHLFVDQTLLLGFLFGVFSYYLQGRGYPYHRYPSEVFLLLLAAIAFADALRTRTAKGAGRHRGLAWKSCAVAGLAFGALVVVPRSLHEVTHFTWRRDVFNQMLQTDLASLGGPALNGKVQCMEMAGGCITALYDARLVQSSGFLYDCYLYPQEDQAAAHIDERERYRNAFRKAFLAHPPHVLIVSSDECGPPDFLYRKLTRWPWFNSYLREHYKLVRNRIPDELERWGGKPALPYGYRIYSLVRQ